ncbi:benzoate 4-monooxygenase cytochrome P450 [Xylariaceae sp. FL0594]|nr:benzoate 4-monooxygenase cytochrome P450 [Xylariaceae sp. FL0594]
MVSLRGQNNTFIDLVFVLVVSGFILLFASVIYNVVFHPLADVPGPFWARATGFPSWYHAKTGRRHIWLLEQFRAYGPRIRPEPNTVLFCHPDAYRDIYSMRSNVRRSQFYTAWKRDERDNTTLNTVDVARHAQKRKLLNLCFTDASLHAACEFTVKHVDRWLELMSEQLHDGDWSAPVDFSGKVDTLLFDITGDLCFGKSFDVKEPGENIQKEVPHCITQYMLFYYHFCRSPFLTLLNWLKPRDPVTDETAYDERELRAESNLLIIAGSDTTAVSLSGIFFYLTGNPPKCDKLVREILATFTSVDEIVYGPKLLSCTYLKACIDEGATTTPPGTIFGTVAWANSRNRDHYGDDADVFRPEQWIADDTNSKKEVARLRSGFHPFSSGPGSCVGQKVAMAEMMIVLARTLFCLEVRRAPGSTLGCAESDKDQFHLVDAYISLRRGPEVQFRKRKGASDKC